MIEREDCKEWYHKDCVEVPSAIWQTKRHSSWICNNYVKKLLINNYITYTVF